MHGQELRLLWFEIDFWDVRSVYQVCQSSLKGKTNIDNAQFGLISIFLWAIAVALIRSSIIFLYIRIFPPRSFHVACYVILALNGALSISIAVADFLWCYPIACLLHDGNCTFRLDIFLFEAINAGLNLALDVTVIFLPTPMLWAMQMPVRKKMLLSGMFGLGIL